MRWLFSQLISHDQPWSYFGVMIMTDPNDDLESLYR